MLLRKSSRPFKGSTPQAQEWGGSHSPRPPKQGRRPDQEAGGHTVLSRRMGALTSKNKPPVKGGWG